MINLQVDPVIPVASAVIGGLFSGLVFALLRSFVWRWYTKPKLLLGSTAATSFDTDDSGDIASRIFRVPIQNDGRSAAENCKPELRMEGKIDHTEYEIRTQLHWYEEENPSRITINSGERAEYNLLRVSKKESDSYIDPDPTFIVEFADPSGWGAEYNIIKWEYHESTGRATNAEVMDNLKRDTFQAVNWNSAEIVTTAGNTDKVSSELKLELGEQRGMVGMNIRFSSGQKLD
jgi:hypothetical protein